ncbi:hypothetical protein PRIPAC_91831 [Pristionchus pacificus]|uniref:Uncharacterized protein n=1 Tax=Pristionchus pacificus TaxID=54126 RepID=A0A2A6CD79_PRIPA|nr:hypothetical protein PRIPAC_91831 [Pristionchus pacificus]|eukprot:PDM76077.1 hypothetical protein PRIPAC_39681 [Pristionchus pacificus]
MMFVAPAARKAALTLTDDEDDSFERVEELNHLEPCDDDSTVDNNDLELEIKQLKIDLTNSKRTIADLKKDRAQPLFVVVAMMIPILLVPLVFPYERYSPPAHSKPDLECPKCPQCPAAPPVLECPSTPTASAESPKVPTCEEKPWDYENPSLKLGDYSYGYGPPTFSRVASYNTNDWSISVTGGFVSAFSGGRLMTEYPHAGEEIIAIDGVDVREKSAQEIYEMIHQPQSTLAKLFNTRSKSRWAGKEWGHMLKLTVRNNTVYFNRIRDAVAEASNAYFKRGALAAVFIIVLVSVFYRTLSKSIELSRRRRFINKSEKSSCDCAVSSSGQVQTVIDAVTKNNGNEAEKTFVQQLSDCAGEEPETTENDRDRHAAETANTEENVVGTTSDLTDVTHQQVDGNTAEEKSMELIDLTTVINAQKVQVEDNRKELEMFADRLAELKRDCERMEKERADLASFKSEAETKSYWLDRMLDECVISQNGG